MKIFLVYLALNSPQDINYNYGLGYISAILRKAGYNSKYMALKNQKDIFELYKKIKIEKPEIIGFSITTSQFEYFKNISKNIKKLSSSFLLCGGIHPTLKPRCILEIPELDAIVRGEGEFPLLDLAKAIENNKNGLLIPTRNEKAITEAVLHLCNDESYTRKLGEMARITVMEKFAWDNIIEFWDNKKIKEK